MRVTILFSRQASVRDGHRLFGFMTSNVIAQLTAAEAHHVKRLDPPTWGKFLQILEDAAQRSPHSRWIISVLYSTEARNVTTRAAMNQLLTANDPGEAAEMGGTLHALLPRAEVTCYNCGEQGHVFRD